MKKIIEKIYLDTVPILLNDVPEKYYKEILDGYKTYIYNKYSSFDFDNSQVSKEELINRFINYEKESLKDETLTSKLSLFVRDEIFEKILEISRYGYKKAKEKYDKSLTEEFIIIDKNKAQEYIDFLNNNLSKVRDFNNIIASREVSEGILDYQYACGNVKDIMSLRLGRHTKRNKSRS